MSEFNTLKNKVDQGGGCKMAYGSGASLSGLSFTPVVAIYIGQYSSLVSGYLKWIAIKGYDTTAKLICANQSSDGASNFYAKCIFNGNNVRFCEFNENFKFYNYRGMIAAFGI